MDALRDLATRAIGYLGQRSTETAVGLVKAAMEIKGVFEEQLLPLVNMRQEAAEEASRAPMPQAVREVLQEQGIVPLDSGAPGPCVLEAAQAEWEAKHGEPAPQYALPSDCDTAAACALQALMEQVQQEEDQSQDPPSSTQLQRKTSMPAPKRRRK